MLGGLGASVEVDSSSDVVRSVTAVLSSLVDDKPSVLTVMVVVVDSVLSSGVVDSCVLVSVDVVLLSIGVVDSSGSTDVVGNSEDKVEELGSVSGGVTVTETVDSFVVLS